MRQKKASNVYFYLAAILGAGLLLRVILGLAHFGHGFDMSCWYSWAYYLVRDGFKAFYHSESLRDYPPGYLYILYLLEKVRQAFGLAYKARAYGLVLKLPSMLADLVTGFYLFRLAHRYLKEQYALFAAAAYIFCPLVLLDSTLWGQVDSILAMFLFMVIYYLQQNKVYRAYLLYGVVLMLKPQAMIFGLYFLLWFIEHVILKDFSLKRLLSHLGVIACAGLIMLVMMLPFGIPEVLKQYVATINSYPKVSLNAYNFWTIFDLNWIPIERTAFGVTYQTWGKLFMLLIIAGGIFLYLRFRKREDSPFLIGAYLYTAIFCFSCRMHERYIFPAIIMLIGAFVISRDKKMLISYLALGTMGFINCFHVLFFYDADNYNWHDPVLRTLSILMLISVLFFLWYLNEAAGILPFKGPALVRGQISDIGLRETERQSTAEDSETSKVRAAKHSKSRGRNAMTWGNPKPLRFKTAEWIFLAVIILVYGIIAFTNLGNRYAPETDYSITKEGEITIDLRQVVDLGTVWYYKGYNTKADYVIEIADECDGDGQPIYHTVDYANVGYEYCFSWRSAAVSQQARYIRITLLEPKSGDSLLELVLTDSEGNVIDINNKNEQYRNLFDEQEMFEGRRTYMNSTIFDEIYHARTAYEMIHGLYCYENTHPPLGKAIMALGILIFGMNPFGWRFMGTLIGVLMIPVMYLLLKKLLKKPLLCMAGTVIFTFDFMHYVQTRIATIDVFVVFFIMLAYYFMLCYLQTSFVKDPLKKGFLPLGLCGVFMGISWACKWTGIYASIGLALLFFYKLWLNYRECLEAGREDFAEKCMKTILFCCCFFLLLPFVIYTLSYIPFSDGSDRGLLARMLHAQKTMLSYHTSVESNHPFASRWYTWPFDVRPVWYYSGTANGLREGISTFGNPLVWWMGVPAFIYQVYRSVRYRDKTSLFLVVGYLSQYLPWVLIGRETFIYHYFPSVPFLVMMIAYGMQRLFVKAGQITKKKLIMIGAYTALVVLLFVMFYPVLTGTGVSAEFAGTWLKWLSTWQLI